MPISAILFDMDGLLIDSERVSAQAFIETAESYGLSDVYDLFLSLVGTNEAAHVIKLEEELGDQLDSHQFRIDWVDRYQASLAQGVPPLLPGVKETLNALQAHNIPCAVATSSHVDTAEHKLSSNGIRDYFLTITGGNHVEISKPNPEIYLKAAASIQANPATTCALEDSENGVKAGVAAGMQVIQIPNLVPPSEELLKLKHTVCGDMTEAWAYIKPRIG